MNTYTIYFEFFGRKMKTTVKAKDEAEAKMQIAQRITFDKVEREPLPNLSEQDKDHLRTVFDALGDNPFSNYFGPKKGK